MSKPVLVTQHSPDVEPGFFGEYLTEKAIPWHLVRVDQGQALPDTLDAYAGLGLMGGEMSVNDPLPWIDHICRLIREADSTHKPVIGHCLGGQLIAKAMGASVHRHIRQELGWGQLQILDPLLGREWLGQEQGSIPTFQWHGDTFDWPDGARPLLGGHFCSNQAYVIPREGRIAHLGMQCHMEMTDALVSRWVEKGQADVAAARVSDASAVQTVPEMLQNLSSRCSGMRVFTRRLYDRWIQGLAAD